jgi:thymidylate kinase
MLITFSGLDGAGKSTLIASLRSALERAGHSVAVLHMNDDVGVYAYARMARNLLLRLMGQTRRARTARAGSLRAVRNALVWSSMVRACIYPVDLLILAFYRLYFEKLTSRVLLMDRYFYDTLVDLSKDGPHPMNRLLELLTPAPDVPVLLDVTPECAFERKRDYPLAYLERRWVAYHSVFSRVPTCVMLRNGDAQLAQARLWRIVTEHAGRAVPARVEP